MRYIAFVLVGSALLLPTCARPQTDNSAKRLKSYCIVDDPSPTPLNLRTAPYGRIIGNVRNRTNVKILDHTVDSSGKSWVYLADEAEVPLGWAYRNYVKCE